MTRVLIAEDSPAVQRALRTLLEGESDIEIVGVAENGADAVRMCRELRPDLVTMDIYMPVMDGLEATRRIMREAPTRIVIVSSMVSTKDTRTTFEAVRAGAVDVLAKPQGVLRGNYSEVRAGLLSILRRTAEARVLVPAGEALLPSGATASERRRRDPGGIPARFAPSIVCIGGSTGAPAVLAHVLAGLPSTFPVPVLIVQHIARGFAAGMTDWLDSLTPLRVRLAHDGDLPRAGLVLVAPDDRSIVLADDGTVRTVPPSGKDEHTPSVDRLLSSVACVHGGSALGIVLSGMGRDGAAGLLDLRNSGAVTIAQDEGSCVVYGMPRAAMEAGAVMAEMNPRDMLGFLMRLEAPTSEIHGPASRPFRPGETDVK